MALKLEKDSALTEGVYWNVLLCFIWVLGIERCPQQGHLGACDEVTIISKGKPGYRKELKPWISVRASADKARARFVLRVQWGESNEVEPDRGECKIEN